MIRSPSYFSKTMLKGTPLRREPQPGMGMVRGQLFCQWQTRLKGHSSLLHPASFGIRLYECSFICARKPSNPMKMLSP
jgi:hypothetical protein